MSDAPETDPKDGFWSCNIDRRGRFLRLTASLLCIAGAAWFWWGKEDAFWASGLLAIGLVTLYEGLRGWCVVRAFGFKTPL
ncbi:MAG: DUF2892 domain-containing protein [Verrucomicrobiae bacterium]|nr:DUF2892 domain-containing protein [Verrucomicrobiae bacterium]